MLKVAIAAILLLGCEVRPEPEDSPDAGLESSYCEQYQSAPAPCYADSCDVGERVCGNERICQVWEESGAYQCKTLFYCECR